MTILLNFFGKILNATLKSDLFQNIDVEVFKSKMTEPQHVVLDVRAIHEFDSGHIKGAKQIDYLSSEFKGKVLELDPKMTYLVYCRSGRRSADACTIMADLGFEHLYNLEGGIIAWSKQ